MPMTIADILEGRSVGNMQSVGQMQVIPILGEDDDSWAPPDVEASNRDYGHVNVRNTASTRTVVPPGSAFITDQYAQDHGIGDGAIVPAKSAKDFSNARCVQESQGGLIGKEKGNLVVLPASLRAAIIRKESQTSDYSAMWPVIREHNKRYGIGGTGHGGRGDVVDFLKGCSGELDEFVAEFELVDNQVGAIVLVNGQIAGIEVAPNRAFWEFLWVPLIRVCYGSVALLAQRTAGRGYPATRPAFECSGNALEDIEIALAAATRASANVVTAVIRGLASKSLGVEQSTAAKLARVDQSGLIGGVLTERKRVAYASLVAARA